MRAVHFRRLKKKYASRVCTYCGEQLSAKTATRDHVVPVVEGGTARGDNIVLACKTCNERKGRLPIDIFRTMRPCRVNPEYDLTCDRCQSPIWLDVNVPTPIWNAAVKNPNTMLCLLCIDDALAAAGYDRVACRFYFVGKAVVSAYPTEDRDG